MCRWWLCLVGLILVGCPAEQVTPAAATAKWQVVFQDGAVLKGAILSVWGTASDDVWLVGAKDPAVKTNRPTALRLTGKSWSKIDVAAPGADLWWVAGLPAGDVWMAGTQGTIARWHRATGKVEVQATPDKRPLFGILPVSQTEIWAVGGDVNCKGPACGAIWRSDGQSWTVANVPAELLDKSSQWFKIWKHKGNIFVVGSWQDDSKSGAILKYDGTTWSSVSSDNNRTLFTIHGDSTRTDLPNCFAVGGSNTGDITEMQADGSWKRYAEASKLPMLNGIRVPAKGNPVAVGSGGAVYERKTGKWVARTDLPDVFDDFHSVWIDPDGAIWAVGGQIIGIPQTSGLVARFGVGTIATTIP